MWFPSEFVGFYRGVVNCHHGGAIVKAAPTFKPQLVTSKMRLERLLARLPAAVAWRARHGYIVELGAASVQFLSADAESNVVGGTANLLLEIDEAQDVSEQKYLRDFRHMAATSNATTVLYGTAWSQDAPPRQPACRQPSR